VCSGTASHFVLARSASDLVITSLAVKGIVSGFPVDLVRGFVARNGVGGRAARSPDCSQAGKDKLFEAGCESPVNVGFDRVLAAAFRNPVALVIDDVGVVSGATTHMVGASLAIDQIISRRTSDDVSAASAIKIIVSSAAVDRVGEDAALDEIIK